MLSIHFFEQLDDAYRNRRVSEGMRLLERAGADWTAPDLAHDGSRVALRTAQWLDVGYPAETGMARLLSRFTPAMRARMPLRDFLELRLAEAFEALHTEDATTAIDLLEFILKLELELADDRLAALAHFWKGRSHRKKGEYEPALKHFSEARRRAETMREAKLAAVIGIQEAWVVFQRGDPSRALEILRLSEEELKDTDDFISLGNIESARGRVVRRSGEYRAALEHYAHAVEIYSRQDPNHPNLARVLVNAAYVKRLLALQLRKRIDANAGRGHTLGMHRSGKRSYHERYTQLCREALDQLAQAERIYRLHEHHGGTGSVLVNAGQLHLDMGEIDRAGAEALRGYRLGKEKQDQILMARSCILEAQAENVRVDEQMGEEGDTALHADLARRRSQEAVTLARHTQNRRLLAGAYIVCGATAANDFYQEWHEAQQYVARASELLQSGDRDHLWEELIVLKSRILRASGIDETLRAWTEGLVGEKTFQQVTEEFAEIVIPKVWAREGRKVSKVAARLSISPKKVRRILRNTGLLEPGS